jgi:olefin beta-lactone synthetase
MLVNIASRLKESAQLSPDQKAVVFPASRDASGNAIYTQLTFEELDRESDRLARGLAEMGVTQGTRLVLAVPPSLEFIALTFALFKAGAVTVLIDPGMGRENIFRCLQSVNPDGFVAIPLAHAFRVIKRRKFPNARFNVTVNGRRWFWGGSTYKNLLGAESVDFQVAKTEATDQAAIIFTSGSTGPPKGVIYEHGMFNAQVDLLRDFYGIQPGEIDLSGFPLFALFNAAMQVTTVIPDMDPTKPAQVDPAKILEAIRDQRVTQAFGSPAIWNRVGRHCEKTGEKLGTLKRVLSAGAPVPIHVLQRMTDAFEPPVSNRGAREGKMSQPVAAMHTPYGATESLPVASISSVEVLAETASKSREGAGTCVGKPFPQVKIRIVEISNNVIEQIDDAAELPTGEIGEILVQAPSTTRQYFELPEATAMAKVAGADGSFWHRMGDVGWLDETGRLWFCGRKAHIVDTEIGRMFTIPCEAIFNEHPHIFRSALVGIGDKPNQQPVLIAEPEPGHFPDSPSSKEQLTNELLELGTANRLTKSINQILFHRSLPVDIRHNVKIFREKLVPWAKNQIIQ